LAVFTLTVTSLSISQQGPLEDTGKSATVIQ